MDLVAHCGEVNRGSYVHSLVLTDIASGWAECASLVVRESTLLVAALERVRVGLPFTLRALDVDNGSEFVNETMIQYCLQWHRAHPLTAVSQEHQDTVTLQLKTLPSQQKVERMEAQPVISMEGFTRNVGSSPE